MDEQEQRTINEHLAYIADHINEQPIVRIQYFVLDERQNGGRIIEISGRVKKISDTNGIIIMVDGETIPIREITDVLF